MDGNVFLALGTLGGFGRCPNAANWTPENPHGITLYPPRGMDYAEHCPRCGEKIIYPPGDIERLEAIAATGADPGPTNEQES